MDGKKLENEDFLISLCRELAHIGRFTVLREGFVRFENQGFTAFLVLSESHLAIHTWPEHDIAFIDILSSKDISEEEVENMRKHLFENSITVLTLKKSAENIPF